jgi:adenylate cyclase
MVPTEMRIFATMNTRTLEELEDAVRVAKGIGDTQALSQCAVELSALGTTQARALSANARGIAAMFADKHADALECYDVALGLYQELGDRSGAARVIGNIGSVQLELGSFKEALENYQRALDVHIERGERNSVAIMSMGIGNVHRSTDNYSAALEWYHRALQIYKECEDRMGEAGVSKGIGNVHSSTGNYPAALEFYHRALHLHEEQGDRLGAARVTASIGLVYNRFGNYDAALEQYHRALAVHDELGTRSDIAMVCSNIGSVHGNTNNHTAALEYFRRALPLFEEMGFQLGVAGVTSNIASALAHSGSLTEAEALLHTLDAMEINVPGIVLTREEARASLQEQTGNTEDAMATFQAALEIARTHGLALEQAGIHKALRELCQKRNDFAGYIEHNNEYTRITDEINGKETATKLAMQEKQREIDAKDREHEKHLTVLHSTLPKHVAERVARGEVVNDHYDNASVIFLDIVGFTELSSQLSSQEVIALLDNVFTQCDEICKQHNVTKIKTIGDSYMCVSFDSVTNAARVAMEMVNIKSRIKNQESNQTMLQFRIGVHCGPVTAGVIGKERMQYDVWGDTVNVASRMESSGEAGRVHVSEAFALTLEESLVTRHSSLVTQLRGSIDIKGKGLMQTYWLESTT